MDLATYQRLTGLCNPSNESAIKAQLNRVQTILEEKLGYTLDPDKVNENLYTEQGISPNTCSTVDTEDLDEADDVVNAYRQYTVNTKDKYFITDPFTAIHAVKIVRNGQTIKTLDEDDYTLGESKDGLYRTLEICSDALCDSCSFCKKTNYLAIDADWVWQEAKDIPNDLLYVWADMVTYYADAKKDVTSESIGAHSYSKKDTPAVEDTAHGIAVLRKYAGHNGTINKVKTV